MALRYDEIGEILKLIDGSACDEFILETQDVKLVVRRQGANATAAPEPARSTPRLQSAPAAPAPQAARAAPAGAAHDATHAVLAPMVGTFYRSPSPGEPPFVEVGKKVSKGDAVGIIEVMKLFTTIHAEWNGTVTEIGVENAQLVEYGQMLFVITPD